MTREEHLELVRINGKWTPTVAKAREYVSQTTLESGTADEMSADGRARAERS